MNNSPMYEAIKEVISRDYNLSGSEIHTKTNLMYNAITDHVFYQELGHRLGNNIQPLPEYEQWEYFIKDLYIDGQSPGAQMQILDHYGQQGYELVVVNSSLAYLKRRCKR
jgi:hypothetical protein